MLFWVVAIGLTLCASLAVLWPLSGPSRPAEPGADHDLEVYRDQLAEVDRDVARGVVPAEEAEQARAEIGRRILRLAVGGAHAGDSASPTRQGGLVAMTAVLAVPLVAWGMYSALGSPDLPPQPLAERLAKNPADRYGSVRELGEALAACASAADWGPRQADGWWASIGAMPRDGLPVQPAPAAE